MLLHGRGTRFLAVLRESEVEGMVVREAVYGVGQWVAVATEGKTDRRLGEKGLKPIGFVCL